MKLFIIVLMSLIAASAVPADPIAFIRGVEQQDQRVCIIDSESGAVAEVGPGAYDGRPVWSPNGSMLAFETRTESGMGICTVRPDGSELRHLTHANSENRDPNWSPDGKALAYTSYSENGLDTRICVYDLAANSETVWPAEGKIAMMRPVWMPSMRLLYALRPGQDVKWDAGSAQGLAWLQTGSVLAAIGVVESVGKPTTDLFVVTSENAAPLPEWVMPSPGNYLEWAPAPSPDGASIAWESNDGGDREIFVLNKKGAFDVSNHRASDWNPVWSPDGEWLAFESFRDGRRGLYKAYVSTARVSPLAVTPPAENWSLTWAPDGDHIAFVSNRTGNPELFISDAFGNEPRQLTKGDAQNFAPAWRPKGGDQ